jgi:isopenicillin-N epimerase
VFALDTAYGSVKTVLRHACAEAGADLLLAAVPLTGPKSLSASVALAEDEIVELVRRSLLPGTRLAVFDHITSNTAIRLPLERLVAVCKSKGVPVLVDGAHGPLACTLDLATLGVDFYVGNLHKVRFFPRPRASAPHG